MEYIFHGSTKLRTSSGVSSSVDPETKSICWMQATSRVESSEDKCLKNALWCCVSVDTSCACTCDVCVLAEEGE